MPSPLYIALIAVLCFLFPDWWPYLVVAGFGLGPGCCCGSTCAIFSDDFSSDNLATNWTGGTSGTWTVSGGTLNTSSTSAYRFTTATHPDGAKAMKATVSISGSSGDIGRVYIAAVDASTNVMGEVKLGASGYMKLYQNGSLLAQVTGITISTSVAVTLCISAGESFASFMQPNGRGVAYAISAITGTRAGVGTGGTASAVTFDDFSMDRTDLPECPPCRANCPGCEDQVAPQEYEITITGVVDGIHQSHYCPGGGCTGFNNTFIVYGVDPAQIYLIGSTWLCTYFTSGNVACSNALFFRIGGPLGGPPTAIDVGSGAVVLGNTGFGWDITDLGGLGYSCTAVVEDPPYITPRIDNSGFIAPGSVDATNFGCNNTASTCHVEAL